MQSYDLLRVNLIERGMLLVLVVRARRYCEVGVTGRL